MTIIFGWCGVIFGWLAYIALLLCATVTIAFEIKRRYKIKKLLDNLQE